MRASRRAAITLGIALTSSLPAAADEGMWMLHQLSELAPTMNALGLELSPREIWDRATGTGLASAIPSLGGCSSSFVSPDGLIVTNHHCAFGAIQLNSSPEHDYLADGFLARSRAEELDARSTKVYVFKGYDDVTARFSGALEQSLSPEQRTKVVEKRKKELVALCEQDGLRCSVAEMYGGGKYYLFRSLEIRDVRLVYAPPGSVGNYGDEVDNWMWPRHTGDYSFFRAYVGPDGKPADFSPANVPYRPERWLKIATTPLREGDFTMILGYPGKTYRYKSADQVASDTAFYYPTRIAVLKDLMDILKAQGKRGREIEIKLAGWLQGLENSYKNNQGMLEGLLKTDLVGRKRSEEDALAAWVVTDPARAAAYGDLPGSLASLQADRAMTRERDLLLSFLPPPRSATLVSAAVTIDRWTAEKGKPDLERESGYQSRDERTLRQRLVTMQRNLDLANEREVLIYLFRRASALPSAQRITAVDAALAATGKSGEEALVAAVDRLLSGSRLADQAVRLALFDGGQAEVTAAGDPMLEFAAALRKDVDVKEQAEDIWDGRSRTVFPRFIAALSAWRNVPLYPDANSTLRLTFATVKGYEPRDGVVYKPFTTLAGVLEKHTGVEPFDAPQRLRQAAASGLGARWRDAALGDVPVCFLSTNDITGGNSGSPIMNGRGELVGLAFDGNYESMTSDYQFSNALSRTINVDIRYVLWCSEFVDGAANLLRELGVEPATQ